jgi:NAD(P)-dependent dehydrogenase (short-subunit alcohol dehydrogenase family)
MLSPGSPRRPRWRPATSGVTVNCISPGYVWTSLIENQIPDTMKTRGLTREQVMNDVLLAAQPTKQFVTVDQVAALALFLCRDEGGGDHRRQPVDGRRLDGAVEAAVRGCREDRG